MQIIAIASTLFLIIFGTYLFLHSNIAGCVLIIIGSLSLPFSCTKTKI